MDETGIRTMEKSEMFQTFETSLNDHRAEQNILHDRMLASVRDMFTPLPPGVKQTKSNIGNKISLGTLNNLVVYLSAHQRLVTSLLCDIAEGRIGKVSRRKSVGALKTTKWMANKKKKDNDSPPSSFNSDGIFGLKTKPPKDGSDEEPLKYFYTPKEEIATTATTVATAAKKPQK